LNITTLSGASRALVSNLSSEYSGAELRRWFECAGFSLITGRCARTTINGQDQTNNRIKDLLRRFSYESNPAGLTNTIYFDAAWQ